MSSVSFPGPLAKRFICDGLPESLRCGDSHKPRQETDNAARLLPDQYGVGVHVRR